jgi:hypothetical protein
MPREIRLLSVGVGSKMTRQQEFDPATGKPLFAEDGTPAMMDVLELAFVDTLSHDTYVVPLTPQGVEAVEKALKPISGIVIPQPGMVPRI